MQLLVFEVNKFVLLPSKKLANFYKLVPDLKVNEKHHKRINKVGRKIIAKYPKKLERVHIKIASKIIAKVRFPKYIKSSLS